MIGVTIGIGDGWGEVARTAATQMEVMTGMRCVVLASVSSALHINGGEIDSAEVRHPSWLKCFLLSFYPGENEFLVFDADVVCVRPWKPEELFASMGRSFCAVPEENRIPVLVECTNFRLPFPDWYVNGGLLMFGREHQAVWDQVWARHPSYGSWLEQTALNEALRGVEVARLPRIYNSMLHGVLADCHGAVARGAINVHADSFGGKAEEVRKVQSLLCTERGISDLKSHISKPNGISDVKSHISKPSRTDYGAKVQNRTTYDAD